MASFWHLPAAQVTAIADKHDAFGASGTSVALVKNTEAEFTLLKGMLAMKKALGIFAALLLLIPSFSACARREILPLPAVGDYNAASSETPGKEALKVGLIPGLYGDIFNQIILPLLNESGYDVKVVYYDNYAVPNIALSKGQIDLNMTQHYAALNNYKFENNAALSAIAEVPTAPMGIYSSVYSSLKEIENGAMVSVPVESADLSRALIILENAGLIKLDPSINKHEASLSDIASNRYSLVFSTSRADKLALSLMFCELSVIDCSYAEKDNLKLSDALYQEVMAREHLVVIAVQTDRLHEQFVTDIIGIIYSDEYKNAISNEKGTIASCQPPPSFYADSVGFAPRNPG